MRREVLKLWQASEATGELTEKAGAWGPACQIRMCCKGPRESESKPKAPRGFPFTPVCENLGAAVVLGPHLAPLYHSAGVTLNPSGPPAVTGPLALLRLSK